MKKLMFGAVLLVLCGLQGIGFAQEVDIAFGVSGLSAPSGTTNSSGAFLPTMGGGAYPGISGDVLIKHQLGVEAEVFWRGSQNLYGGYQPYRPVMYAFNGIWAPRLTKSITAEVMGGIGGESLRFYTPYPTCDFFSCTTYVSSNHFMGDIGGGIRYYVWRDLFVRPEARLYLVHNNVEFSSGRAARYGVSIGYSFGRGAH
jgi:hypothetical protein